MSYNSLTAFVPYSVSLLIIPVKLGGGDVEQFPRGNKLRSLIQQSYLADPETKVVRGKVEPGGPSQSGKTLTPPKATCS